MKDHQIKLCRNYYTNFRQSVKNCPSMIVIKHCWGYTVEAKDGSYYNEICKSNHCFWCIKSEGVAGWRDKFKDG